MYGTPSLFCGGRPYATRWEHRWISAGICKAVSLVGCWCKLYAHQEAHGKNMIEYMCVIPMTACSQVNMLYRMATAKFSMARNGSDFDAPNSSSICQNQLPRLGPRQAHIVACWRTRRAKQEPQYGTRGPWCTLAARAAKGKTRKRRQSMEASASTGRPVEGSTAAAR